MTESDNASSAVTGNAPAMPSRAMSAMNAVSAMGAIELGVSGLPPTDTNMISGGLYALNVRTSSTRFPLVTSSLQSALAAGRPCTIITGAGPDEFLQRLEFAGGFPTAKLLAEKRLVIFSMQDEFPKKMFRYGADRFLQELEDFQVPEDSYLLIDQADDLLSLHDLAIATKQIRIVSRWFKVRRVTGLLVFSRASERSAEALNALMDYLTGIARLTGDRNGLELTFLFWQSSAGAIAARNFLLTTTSAGLYAVAAGAPLVAVHSSEHAAANQSFAAHQPVATPQPVATLERVSPPDHTEDGDLTLPSSLIEAPTENTESKRVKDYLYKFSLHTQPIAQPTIKKARRSSMAI